MSAEEQIGELEKRINELEGIVFGLCREMDEIRKEERLQESLLRESRKDFDETLFGTPHDDC